MITTITRQDPRFPVLRRARNARFPENDAECVSRIFLCETPEDAASALKRAVDAGMRPTVRSSGHCYEDFVVNNPDGALIDVAMMNRVGRTPGPGGQYWIESGAALGAAYTALYRLGNVTLPAGTCYSVAAGGHISGGGYGMLARQYGLSVDWLTGVDILTVDAHGHVVTRHVNQKDDADLFRALRGAGGAGFGLITRFYFERLPPAPVGLSHCTVVFPWKDMTESRFVELLQSYGEYMTGRGTAEDTRGMFTFFGLTHRTENGGIFLSVSMHDLDGHGGTEVAEEFLDRFIQYGAQQHIGDGPLTGHGLDPSKSCVGAAPCERGKFQFTTRPWIEAMIADGGGPYFNADTRAKYKSCYMKQNFTTEEAKRFYRHLTRDAGGVIPTFTASVDSYGGAVNDHGLLESTAQPHRSSRMKLQFQMYWHDPAEDEARLKFYDEMYSDIYSANVAAPYAGTPFPGDFYEGCYINYPDVDMLRYSFWPELYFGTEGLCPFLKSVKRTYDPHNIFHHSMTVRA